MLSRADAAGRGCPGGDKEATYGAYTFTLPETVTAETLHDESRDADMLVLTDAGTGAKLAVWDDSSVLSEKLMMAMWFGEPITEEDMKADFEQAVVKFFGGLRWSIFQIAPRNPRLP